jgi:hypothetical protein
MNPRCPKDGSRSERLGEDLYGCLSCGLGFTSKDVIPC